MPPSLAPPSDESNFRPGPHRVALLATVLTWPLLLVGGSVTVYRVGMAVPDWPQTFGQNMFLFNFWDASRGVFIEHTHRLFGAAVGFACIVLSAWFALAERRRWMKVLGGLALLSVIGQGFLGGMRVRLNSSDLAFVHGCTAQAFFALMVALCVLTGRVWHRSGRADLQADPSGIRWQAAALLVLAYGQVVLGATIRHFGRGVGWHALLAGAVGGLALVLAMQVERNRTRLPALVSAARASAVLVMLQAALGVLAWLMLRPFDGIPREVTPDQAVVRIGHQGLGALVLASAVVLALRAFRRLSPSGSAHPEEAADSPGAMAGPRPAEAMAS